MKSGLSVLPALTLLGAAGMLPATATGETATATPLPADAAQVREGAQLFSDTCAVCHGEDAIGGVKDLRRITPETRAKFEDIVLKGIYSEKGMVSFADQITPAQLDAISAYLTVRASEDRGE